MLLDKGPMNWVRKGKGRKGKPFFTQGKNLVRGINIKLRFSRTLVQDPLDQDKSGRVFSFFVVRNLVGRERDFITFRYLKLNSKVNSLLGCA